MEPLAAKGRPRGDFVTHGVEFEGSPKWVDFRSAPGAQKSRWMLALGRQRVAKSATAVGQEILLEKMVPRAHLARAQLINKLIKFREFIIFRIFKRIKCVRSDTPWAVGLANYM